MYDLCHCQPFSTAAEFRDAYVMSYKLAHEFPPETSEARDRVIVPLWCFDTVMTHVLQSPPSPSHSEEWTCPLLLERNGSFGHYRLLSGDA